MSRRKRKPGRRAGGASGELSLLALSRVMRSLDKHERHLAAALNAAACAPGDGGRWPADALLSARAARVECVSHAVACGALAPTAKEDAHTVAMLETLYGLLSAALPGDQVPAAVEPMPTAAWGDDTLVDDCVLRVRERAIGWWLLGAAVAEPDRWERVIERCWSQVPPEPLAGSRALLWQPGAPVEYPADPVPAGAAVATADAPLPHSHRNPDTGRMEPCTDPSCRGL